MAALRIVEPMYQRTRPIVSATNASRRLGQTTAEMPIRTSQIRTSMTIAARTTGWSTSALASWAETVAMTPADGDDDPARGPRAGE